MLAFLSALFGAKLALLLWGVDPPEIGDVLWLVVAVLALLFFIFVRTKDAGGARR